ncbi:metallophosphoesterase [Streptomyces armeniacus]|uniref:Metallophosphoesterase n=1 Tax=Streptomyces armeniacus TaxID=83291 RepID=A0A345XMP5_9ACTN|nr:metallophosphoesterase [Streptomyces armeniacus]AXK32911.1 metallophosphoesterase [Streptomyces armeniacus]
MIALTILLVLAIVSTVVTAHWYLWRRLVRDVSAPGGWWRRTGTVLAFAFPACAFAAFVTRQSEAPFLVQRMLAWPGFLWMALLLYLLLALLVGELVRPLLRRVLARRDAVRAAGAGAGSEGEGERVSVPAAPAEAAESASTSESASASTSERESEEDQPEPADGARPERGGEDPARRLFIARTLAVGATTVAAVTVGAGAYSVLNGPTLKRLTVPLAKLPRSAHGYRIAVVSDIHLGPILGRSHTRRIVDMINGTQPDLVAIVGDLVDGSVADLGPAAAPLAELESRHGSFFVTGNHEYFGDAGEWLDYLREIGVHPLENARRELPGFDLAGVNDLEGENEGEGPDFGKALGDRDTSRASVLLAHQPVQIHDAVDHGVDLQLSGHTHGGQVWPGNYLAGLANPTVAGLERYGDTQLYVTRGAGAFGPPVRVGAESDVTVVTLASKQA